MPKVGHLVIKKYALVAGSVISLVSLLGYQIFDLSKPLVGTILKEEGRVTIFDSKSPNFSKWKKLYSYFKDSLIREGIVPDGEITDSQRAFVFKNWCDKSLKSNSSVTLNKARHYCSMTLGIYALEKEGVQLIEDVIAKNKRRTVWAKEFESNKERIISSGLFRGIEKNIPDRQWERYRYWCKKRAKDIYDSKNPKFAEYFSTWCVTRQNYSEK